MATGAAMGNTLGLKARARPPLKPASAAVQTSGRCQTRIDATTASSLRPAAEREPFLTLDFAPGAAVQVD
jgi:hypothetical protein